MFLVKDLVAELMQINQEQPVWSLVYVADDFEFGDGWTPTPTPEQLGKIIEQNTVDFSPVAEQMTDAVFYFMQEFAQQDEDGDEEL